MSLCPQYLILVHVAIIISAQPPREIVATTDGGEYIDTVPYIVGSTSQSPGWILSVGNLNTNNKITYDQSTGTYFMGPYVGDGSDGIWELSQEFTCNKRSKVNLAYTMYACGPTERNDYIRSYINDNVVLTTRRFSNTFTNTLPETDDDVLVTASNCKIGWHYQIQPYSAVDIIDDIAADTPFTVKFDLYTTGTDE